MRSQYLCSSIVRYSARSQQVVRDMSCSRSYMHPISHTVPTPQPHLQPQPQALEEDGFVTCHHHRPHAAHLPNHCPHRLTTTYLSSSPSTVSVRPAFRLAPQGLYTSFSRRRFFLFLLSVLAIVAFAHLLAPRLRTFVRKPPISIGSFRPVTTSTMAGAKFQKPPQAPPTPPSLSARPPIA
jgi:hypothetical protein